MSRTTEMNSQAPVCPDWVWLRVSNVHIAKDRAWFKTYTPFASVLTDSLFTPTSSYLPVLGIGSVEIPTKRYANRTGVSSHGSLHLKQVLHVPDFICNVLGEPLLESDGYTVDHSNRTIRNPEGKLAAFFDPSKPLNTIKLRVPPSGPRLGPSVLRKDGLYMLSCRWEPLQQRRWLEFCADRAAKAAPLTGVNPPYTAAEKAFLKARWRNEYRFLLVHGLRIHSDEDRAQGRAVLRALMQNDDSDEQPHGGHPEEESSDGESDLEGRQADRNFSPKQTARFDRGAPWLFGGLHGARIG